MCWKLYVGVCWWMLRRSDVEVGSSPIFPGFLAPHGHKFSQLYSMSFAHYKFEVFLVIVAYIEFVWNILARFDNFYEIYWFMWILSEFFHHPLSARVKHISEVLIFDEGIDLSCCDCMRMVLVEVEDCDPCCWEFLFLLYTCDFRVIAWGQASISLGMFDVCEKYMF